MTRVNVADLVTFDRKSQERLARDLWQAGKKGRRAVRNAHKATLDELNEAARKELAKAPFKPSRAKYKRGKGRRTTYTTKKGKTRKIIPFREAARKSTSYSFSTKMQGDQIVSRTWLNDKQYYNYLGPMWDGGFTPAKNTKWQGSPVRGIRWRYGPARKPEVNRRVQNRMELAILTQMAQGRTMTPRELRGVLR